MLYMWQINLIDRLETESYKEKHFLFLRYSAFPPSSPAFWYIPSILFILTHHHSFAPFHSSISLYMPEFSPVCPPHVLSSSSQLIPCAPVLQFRLQYIRVLGLKAQLPLLLSFPRLGSVPVSFHRLIVPDHWCFRVADVAGVSCVMGWIHQKWLGRKRTQVPPLKVVHVLWTDEWEQRGCD